MGNQMITLSTIGAKVIAKPLGGVELWKGQGSTLKHLPT